MPHFFGLEGEGTDCSIEIENLLHDAPNASFIDVKLGTSAVTMNKRKQSAASIAIRKAKDKRLNLTKVGFCVSGFCRKDGVTGEIIEKVFKFNSVEDRIPRVLWNIISDRNGQLWEEGFFEIT